MLMSLHCHPLSGIQYIRFPFQRLLTSDSPLRATLRLEESPKPTNTCELAESESSISLSNTDHSDFSLSPLSLDSGPFTEVHLNIHV